MLIACVAASVNIHDSVLLPRAITRLEEAAEHLHLSLIGVPLTLDSGFDGKENDNAIRAVGMVPIVKPNMRNTKDKKKIIRRKRAFKKIATLYTTRHTIERGFAWEDKYRKLVIRYERLEATANGFRYLAATMVNYRALFGRNLI